MGGGQVHHASSCSLSLNRCQFGMQATLVRAFVINMMHDRGDLLEDAADRKTTRGGP